MTHDPTYDPTVPASTTPHILIPAPSCAARIAAGGTTTSLGTGKIELSIAINSTTPA